MPKNRQNLAVSSHPAPRRGGSLWISANAGSGKTYQLTRQVVKLMLLGVPPERICCITYTKAAASEMRSRVIARLRELLLADAGERETLIRAIMEETGPTSVPPEILERAPLLFGSVLDSPSGGLQLTTIHGFCQQLLRAFPLEAGVAPHFTVADEAQTANLIAQAKHRLLTRSETVGAPLAEAIALVAGRMAEQTFDRLVKTMLEKREPWQATWANETPETYRRKLYEALHAPTGTSEDELAAALLQCLNDGQKHILRVHLTRLQGEKAAYKKKLGERGAQWLASAITLDDWLDIFLTQKFTPRADLQKGEFAPGSPLGDVVAHCIDSAMRFIAARGALALAEESYALALIARELLALYATMKEERSLIDYSDLIEKTRAMLSSSSMLGWVMSKLDHRIDHLLVDEAQDTSAEQWRIVHALVDDLVATSGGEGSAGVARSLFVVGDEKQSIFSFQGAAPELYASKHQDFDILLQHSPAPLEQQWLEASFRSAPAIMRLVDQVANSEGVRQSLSAVGRPQKHIARSDITGRVVLHPPVMGEDTAEHEPFAMPRAYRIARSGHQLLADAITRQISDDVNAKRWRAKDILVLVRSRSGIVLPLLRSLQRAGIPVAGMDRLVLSDHLAVKDLLALMRVMHTPGDDLALAQVLRSPLIGMGEDELYALAHDRAALTLWSRIEHHPLLQRWQAFSHAAPYDFLTHVLEVSGTRKNFALRFGGEIHEILDELKEQAANMPASMAPTLANFVNFISASDRQIKREMEEGGQDQVRVMTVHGAKGLEASMVIIADAISTPPQKDMISHIVAPDGVVLPIAALSDTAKEATAWDRSRDAQKRATWAEYNRLLYVALTRARQELHLFGIQPKNRKEPPPESWYAITKAAMQQLPHWNDDDTLVMEDTAYSPQKSSPPVQATVVSLPAWVTGKVPKPVIKASISPSRLAKEPLAPFIARRGEGARERGVRIHRILQFIGPQTDEAGLEELIEHLAPDWSDPERAQTALELWQLVEENRWLWTSPSQAEISISGTLEVQGQRYPVIGQIDRLVETPDALVVLDYKTGRDIPPAADAVSDSYLLQMKLYVALLETLYPGRTIRPVILWTAGPRLMWLDEAVNAIGWERAQLGRNP